MKRYLALLSLVLFAASVIYTSIGRMQSGSTFQSPANSRPVVTQLEEEQPMVLPDGYISASDRHKVMVSADDAALYGELTASGGVLAEENYGSFRLLTINSKTLESVQGRAEIRDDMNVITLNGYQLDTTAPEATLSSLPVEFVRTKDAETRAVQSDKGSRTKLFIVQFSGPIQDNWYKKLVKTGARVVSYVATNGYIVEATNGQIEKLDAMRQDAKNGVQYVGFYEPAFRTTSVLRNAYTKGMIGSVDITVQVVNNHRADETITQLTEMASHVIRQAHPVLGYQNITLTVPASQLAEISQIDNVFGVEPFYEPRLLDERQGQIMAGNITGSTVNGPGYLTWLQSKGFSGTGQFNFVVDVTDDGIDRGSNTDVNQEYKVDGSASGASRLVYNNNYTGDASADGGGGHGNLNASVIFGYNNLTGTAYEDATGHNYGLGIAPWVKVGNTKVFSNGSAATFTQSATVRLKAAYTGGARISNNSWGYTSGNSYNTDSQEHDRIVRDADSAATGNQELTVVFAAGNSGSGANTVRPPATAKNVITVAAFENDRQTGTDGCATDNTGANNVNDVIGFSSRGPCSDGRVKPDLGAPGTHIQGAASRSTVYSGGGVCNKYWPTGQTLYAWSSGTSHSAPGVAGAAALVRQYFINQGWGTPSPAMVKAYLANSTRYMNGVGANDTLPSNNQGMGSVNLGTGFDGVQRVNLDQTRVFAATGETYSTSGTIANTSKPFRVTLAWTDAAGPTTGNAWVNNLDLEVTVGTVTYKGNVFAGANSTTGGSADLRNNMESVFLPAGTSGNVSVRVVATNIAGDGVPGNTDTTDQDFALVIYNATTGGTPTPDYTVSTSPTSGTVTAGSSTTSTVTVGSVNGFTGTVNLTASGLPSGASAAFSPASISSGAGTSTMTISTTSATVAGAYPVTITGTSGTTTRTASYTLNVTASGGGGGTQTVTGSNTTAVAIPDNNTTGITSVINIPTGLTIQSVSASVNITHSYRGDVQIELISPAGTTTTLKSTSSSDSAANIIATYAPTTFTGQNSAGNWTLRVKDLASADTGTLNNWNLSITGTAAGGGGTTGDFTLSLATTTGTWRRGSTYTRTVYVNRTGGHSSPVTLSYSASKTGLFSSVTASVNPVPATGTSSVMTFRVSTTAPTGSATVTIIGKDGNNVQRSTTLSLSITT